jgi:hypothetical protein
MSLDRLRQAVALAEIGSGFKNPTSLSERSWDSIFETAFNPQEYQRDDLEVRFCLRVFHHLLRLRSVFLARLF